MNKLISTVVAETTRFWTIGNDPTTETNEKMNMLISAFVTETTHIRTIGNHPTTKQMNNEASSCYYKWNNIPNYTLNEI